jgi:hypothetical protein
MKTAATVQFQEDTGCEICVPLAVYEVQPTQDFPGFSLRALSVDGNLDAFLEVALCGRCYTTDSYLEVNKRPIRLSAPDTDPALLNLPKASACAEAATQLHLLCSALVASSLTRGDLGLLQ